jgi:hypothetical protein
VSFGLGFVVSLLTPPPPAEEVDRYFLEGQAQARPLAGVSYPSG